MSRTACSSSSQSSAWSFMARADRMSTFRPDAPGQQVGFPEAERQRFHDRRYASRPRPRAGPRLVRAVPAPLLHGRAGLSAHTRGSQSGQEIKLYLKVAGAPATALIPVPYNESSARYEIEFWGYTGGGDLGARLDDKGRAALSRGELLNRPDPFRAARKILFAKSTMVAMALPCLQRTRCTPSCRCISSWPGPTIRLPHTIRTRARTSSSNSAWCCLAGTISRRWERAPIRTMLPRISQPDVELWPVPGL
jgi:hypothetical protein